MLYTLKSLTLSHPKTKKGKGPYNDFLLRLIFSYKAMIDVFSLFSSSVKLENWYLLSISAIRVDNLRNFT